MNEIMHRLESGERWWPAEIALRSLGAALLALCLAAALWLYRSYQSPPAQGPRPSECMAAIAAFLGWSLGWAFLVEGPRLFKLVPLPPRHRRFHPDAKDIR